MINNMNQESLQEKDDNVDFKKVFFLALSKWYLIILSIVICLVVAFYT